ncbi:unnamed protein product, partial [Amoebophrya sp. A25]
APWTVVGVRLRTTASDDIEGDGDAGRRTNGASTLSRRDQRAQEEHSSCSPGGESSNDLHGHPLTSSIT